MDQPTAGIIDQATATIIVGVIGAISSVAVALIATRSRINMPQPTSINEITSGVYTKKSAFVRMFRVLGLAFVVVLYVISIIAFLLFSEASYMVYVGGSSFGFDWGYASIILMYVLPWGLLCLLFLAIARWGRKRLKRSHV